TSPSGYNYVYWKFGDPTRDERIQKLYKMASLSSLENIHSEKDYVESLKANYTDELYLQEIEGQFINTSVGVIYKYFSRTTHALQSEDAELLEYDRNLPLLLTFDFNHTPIVCLAA
ncbi:MAG: terminase large subunit domain-containing protein, partial [Dolichospermum sp.]